MAWPWLSGVKFGLQPSASRAIRRRAASGGTAWSRLPTPNQMGIGRWMGIGLSPAWLIRWNAPRKSTTGRVHSARRTSTCSALRRPRFSKVSFRASNSPMALTSVPHSVWGKIAPTFMASARLDELLQASQPGRVRLALVAIAPVGERHFTDVDVATRVDGQPVRRHELARLEPGRALAQPRQQLALVTVEADARPDVGHVVVDAHAAADLTDVEATLRAALHEQA